MKYFTTQKNVVNSFSKISHVVLLLLSLTATSAFATPTFTLNTGSGPVGSANPVVLTVNFDNNGSVATAGLRINFSGANLALSSNTCAGVWSCNVTGVGEITVVGFDFATTDPLAGPVGDFSFDISTAAAGGYPITFDVFELADGDENLITPDQQPEDNGLITVDGTGPVVTLTAPANGGSYAVGQSVTVDYVCSDAETGVNSCVGTLADGAALDTSTPGTGFSFIVTGTNGVGLITEVTNTYDVVDSTAPVVVLTTPADGVSYSIDQSVTADYVCSDPESGIASCVGTLADGAALDTSTPGTGLSFTVTGTNGAGGVTMVTNTYNVVDPTSPVVTLTSPANGGSYLIGEAVTADYACSDPETGITSCVGTLADGAALDTSAAGTGFSFTVTGTNGVGLFTEVTHTYDVVDDPSPPVVTLTTPANGGSYTVGQAVTVDYACSDAQSGIESCIGTLADGAALDTSTVGTGLSFTVTGTNGVGGEATVTHTYDVVDSTPPVVTLSTPANGVSYTVDDVVIVDYACSDAQSGIESCVGTLADGATLDTSTAGTGFSFTVTGTNGSALVTVVTHTYEVVAVPDTTPPVVTLTMPADGASYLVDQAVVVDYECSDPESGVESCVGTLANGAMLDTSTAGTGFSFTVTGTNGEELETTVTHTYDVVAVAEDIDCPNRRAITKNLLWGDLHIHTAYSMDAYNLQTRNTPWDAYAFAQGATIGLPPLDQEGNPLQTRKLAPGRELDFAAVTDHSEFLGEVRLCTDPTLDPVAYDSLPCVTYRENGNLAAFVEAKPDRNPDVCGIDGQICADTTAEVWQDTIDAANTNTVPCDFTSFVAYEWSAVSSGSSLHRNIIFRNDSVPLIPFSAFSSDQPQDLWDTLDEDCLSESGCEAISIPHNTNRSNGKSLKIEYGDATTLDEELAIAEQRNRLERLLEITQHKGTSECLPGFTNDESCDFELVNHVANPPVCQDEDTDRTCVSEMDTFRGALKAGLSERERIGVNPLMLGAMASTDTHNGTAGDVDEDRFRGHKGSKDASPYQRIKDKFKNSPGGLIAVWAEQNTRDSIFDALKRRETYGTSGPRISVRFFGGAGLRPSDCQTPSVAATGNLRGTPMGGEIIGNDIPRMAFLIEILADRTPIDRVQVIKGYLDDSGIQQEEILEDTDLRHVLGEDDLASCGGDFGVACPPLCGVIRDSGFQTHQPAVYYLRVLEYPTPRWSTYDCVFNSRTEALPMCQPGSLQEFIQERAWSSPIWYLCARRVKV